MHTHNGPHCANSGGKQTGQIGWKARNFRLGRFVRAWAPVVVAAPALVFPLKFPWLSVSLLTVACVVLIVTAVRGRGEVEARGGFDTPLRLPLIVLAGLALVGTYLSPYLGLSLPKLAGIVLGLLTFRAVLLTGVSTSRIRLLTWAYLVVGCATVLAGLFAGPAWKGKMWPWWNLPASTIPRLMSLPGAEDGVNANALAATTLLFLPLLVALLCAPRGQNEPTRAAFLRRVGGEILERALYGLVIFAMLAVLVLCWSRTVWFSAAISILLVIAIRSRIVSALSGVAGAAACVGAWWLGLGRAFEILDSVFSGVVGRFASDERQAHTWLLAFRTLRTFPADDRLRIWSVAYRAIREHPFTGVGLGAFRGIVQASGIDGVPREQVAQVTHAHNVFLQIALDVGLPGLVAYLALLAIVTFMAWDVRRRARDSRSRSLCLGLWGCLVALHLFGLTDSISLGAKVGLFFWWNIGLIAALYRVTERNHERSLARDEDAGSGYR